LFGVFFVTHSVIFGSAVRQIKLAITVSFWAHENMVYRIVNQSNLFVTQNHTITIKDGKINNVSTGHKGS